MSARKELGLVAATLLLAFLFFTLIEQRGAVGASSPKATVVTRAAQPTPQFGWKIANSQEWALRPGATLTADHPTFVNSAEKVRLAVSSAQPVNIGFMTRLTDETEMDLCAAASVVSATRECELPAGSAIKFHVEDLRTGHNFAVGAGAWLLGGTNKPMIDATTINRVKLDSFAWTCIANCSP